MTTVHPTFDPKTKTWFVDSVEAPSIRELKRLLPRRMKIRGYFPQGYQATRATGLPTRLLVRETFSPIRMAASSPVHTPKPKRFYTAPQKTNHKVYDHDLILSLWVEGLSGPEIGRKLGLPCSTTAGGIVAAHRIAGDPRALSRSTNGQLIAAAYARKRAMGK
jgi:hypothetical protein